MTTITANRREMATILDIREPELAVLVRDGVIPELDVDLFDLDVAVRAYIKSIPDDEFVPTDMARKLFARTLTLLERRLTVLERRPGVDRRIAGVFRKHRRLNRRRRL
jgi:hypothetical protein